MSISNGTFHCLRNVTTVFRAVSLLCGSVAAPRNSLGQHDLFGGARCCNMSVADKCIDLYRL